MMLHYIKGNDIPENFKEFSEMVPGGFYLLDLNYRFVCINQFTLETAHAKLEDVLGRPPLEIHPRDLAEEIISHYDEVLKTKASLDCEEKIVDMKTGEAKYFECRDLHDI